MPKSRSKKALYNIVTSALLDILSVLSGMILPRYILQYFGSSYNGITASATQFFSLIAILTLGVTASTRVALYKSLAKDDIDSSSAIVCATEQYMRKVGRILGVYIVVLAVVYPLVVHTGFHYWEVSTLILIVGISSFAEYYFGITYRTFLSADQSIYISNIFFCISVVLNLAISVFLITSGYSIQIVKLGSAVVFILRPLLQYIYVTRKYKLNKNCKPDMTALKKRGDAMMHALANIVHDNTAIVILTLFTDVKIVSVYTVYRLVMNALKKIQLVFTAGTEPIFGSMWANEEKYKIGKNLSVFEYFVNSFNAMAFGSAIVMILPFVALYVPKNVTDVNYIRPVYAVLASLAFATQGMRTPYIALVQGIGHYKETRKAAMIEAGINIVVSVVLVNFIGIVGVAIGALVANLYRSIQYAMYIDDHVVVRGKHIFICKFIWTLATMAVIAVPGWYVVSQLSLNSWIQFIKVTAIVGIYSVLVVLISSVIFYRNDLKYALQVAKAMVTKKRKRKP